MDFALFSQQQFAFHPELNIDYIYSNDMTLDLATFTAEIFAQIAYYWNDYLCLNVGWRTEKVDLSLKQTVSFEDCYKDVILTYCDNSNWKGKTAKWIDKC